MSYGVDDGEAWKAMHALAAPAAAVVDRTGWGALRAVGPGALALLQGQTTADVAGLSPGQGCEAVFLTATGRTVDLVLVVVESKESVLLLPSPGMTQPLLERLDRHIFPCDQVRVEDASQAIAMLTLLGSGASAALHALCPSAVMQDVVSLEPGFSRLLPFDQGRSLRVVAECLLGASAPPALTLLCTRPEPAQRIRQVLAAQSCVPVSDSAFGAALLAAGRPMPAAELVPGANALEAGLYHAVSLSKGCYMGQETLSKVHVQGHVKQRLVGLELCDAVQAGDAVHATWGEGPRLGRVTSACTTPAGKHVAMMYLRTSGASQATAAAREAGVGVAEGPVPLGLPVSAGGVAGVVVQLPYPTYSFPAAAAATPAPPAARKLTAADAARRAAKLAARQAAIEAWKAAQEQGAGGA